MGTDGLINGGMPASTPLAMGACELLLATLRAAASAAAYASSVCGEMGRDGRSLLGALLHLKKQPKTQLNK